MFVYNLLLSALTANQHNLNYFSVEPIFVRGLLDSKPRVRVEPHHLQVGRDRGFISITLVKWARRHIIVTNTYMSNPH